MHAPDASDPVPPAGLPSDIEATYNPDRTSPMGSVERDRRLESSGDQRPTAGMARLVVHEETPDLGHAEGVDHAPHSYVLKQPIGRGGFGEVWEALQVSLSRPVAVKRLRRDLAEDSSDSMVSNYEISFRHEAHVTASLDHPNIVPIHDLGLDDQGQPMLAMKLVRGTPWVKVIRADFDALPPDEYYAKHIPILVAVTQAVAFAHARGILHRDIKPIQVMVGEYGEVLLMDWGLAALLDPGPLIELGHDPSAAGIPVIATASSPSGTSSYMAPEQTRKDPSMLGKWTDVYLLGGCLYFLLTGRHPHQAGDAKKAFAMAAAGLVVPVAQAAPGRQVPEELIAIVDAALAPLPEDRTPSAEAFLAQLQGFLSGATRRRESADICRGVEAALAAGGQGYGEFSELEARLGRAKALWPGSPDVPRLEARIHRDFSLQALGHGDLVLARVQAERLAPGSEERTELLARVAAATAMQRRLSLTRRLAVGAVIVCLGAIIVGGAFVARRISAERNAAESARAAESVAKTVAELKAREALEQSVEAERARGDSEELARFMINGLRLRIAKLGTQDEMLKQIADRALAYYSGLNYDTLTDEEAFRLLQGFEELNMLFFSAGDPESLERAALKIRDIAQRQIDRRGKSPGWVLRRASAMTTLAASYTMRGRPEEAATVLRGLSVELREQLEKNPADVELVMGYVVANTRLGECLRLLNRNDEALELARTGLRDIENLRRSSEEVASLAPLLRELAIAHARVGDALSSASQFEESAREYRASIEPIRRAIAGNPDVFSWRIDLGSLISSEADSLEKLGRIDEAIASKTESIEAFKDALAIDPASVQALGAMARATSRLSAMLQRKGRLDESLAAALEASGIFDRIIGIDPTNTEYALGKRNHMHRLVTLYLRLDRVDDAERTVRESFDLTRNFVSANPKNPDMMRNLGIAHARVADVLEARGRIDEAIAEYRETLRLAVESLKAAPKGNRPQQDFAMSSKELSRLLVKAGRFAEARTQLEATVATAEEVAARSPGSELDARTIIDTHDYLARACLGLGDLPAAATHLAAAREALDRHAAANPANMDWVKRNRRSLLPVEAALLAGEGRMDDAVAKIRELAVGAGPDFGEILDEPILAPLVKARRAELEAIIHAATPEAPAGS